MRKSIMVRVAAALGGLVLAAILTLDSRVTTRRVSASTITVTSTADSGAGSLRDAVSKANAGDTITFNLALPATITLTSGEILINQNLTITGPGANLLTISGNNSSGVFDIGSGNVAISGLTIANGMGGNALNNGGAAIFNNVGSTLSVFSCTFSNNSAPDGGAILNQGRATTNACTFTNNSAGFGAAIENDSAALVAACTFTNNSATGDGGAIFNHDAKNNANITECTFTNNSAGASGGAIETDGTGTETITACTFSSNSTFGDGGAVSISGGAPTFANCTLTGNTVSTGVGGAFSIHAASPTIVNCTLSGNSALSGGGGINVDGTPTVANCTLSGNSSQPGGGILVTQFGALILQNTIIANSTGGDCALDKGTIGVNSHNLIQDGSCGPLLSGNPKLGPLQNNGGVTSTMALLAGSPAIDQGDDSVLGPPLSLTTDQRGAGFPRKSGLHVDIGAFELPQPAGPVFDTCLKDNTSGNLLQWNSTTGQYLFTRCSNSFTLSGTGAVGLVNGIRTLTDFKTDRRISAGFNTGPLTGNATIYLLVTQGVWQTFRIVDTNPSAVCKC